MATINYTARLHSTTADGILAHTSELYDEGRRKFQSAINEEVKQRLDGLGQAAAAADGKIKPVQATAEAAKNTAEAAKAASGTATSTATAAQGKAAEAKTAADAAKAAAETATSTANTARSTANEAKSTADAAAEKAELVKNMLYPVEEGTKNLLPVAFTDYIETMPSGVLQTSITRDFTIVYVAAANCFIAKDASGKYHNNFTRAEYWQDVTRKTIYADKVYWRFNQGRLTPYLYHPTQKKLVAVPSDKEAQLDAALKNKLDAAAFNSYKGTNDAAVQAAQAAGSQAQQAAGKLTAAIGGFTSAQFDQLKNRVEALENLLKLA